MASMRAPSNVFSLRGVEGRAEVEGEDSGGDSGNGKGDELEVARS